MDAVEASGGALLPDRCEPEVIRLSQPTIHGMRRRPVTTSGCGQESRFVIPYERVPGTKNASEEAAFVTVCAVDDDMGKWPIFAHTVEEDSA